MILAFTKSLDKFMKDMGIEQIKHKAAICGVQPATYSAWFKNTRKPTVETIQNVSNDLAAVERFLSVTEQL